MLEEFCGWTSFIKEVCERNPLDVCMATESTICPRLIQAFVARGGSNAVRRGRSLLRSYFNA